jgi:hypothetical protein
MSHLSLETLSRLVDEAPSTMEAAHLDLCDACRQELVDLRADVTALAALPALAPAGDAWPALERRLAEEGLVHAPARTRGGRGALLQMAAGIVLFVLGTGVGAFVLAPQQPASSAAPLATTPQETRAGDTDQAPSGAPRLAANTEPVDPVEAERAPQRAVPEQPQPSAPSSPAPQPAPRSDDVRFASNSPAEPRTAEEALAFMRSAESTYLEALTRYAEMAGGFEGGDPAARLAALEGIMLTTRAALGVAPADPVINGYHMTALAQRDATLRQIAATSSQSWF